MLNSTLLETSEPKLVPGAGLLVDLKCKEDVKWQH
jgi:hypothetical protein